jgi:aspartate dehydrogenase
MRPRARFGVIGYGAITEEIVRCLEARSEPEALAAVLVRPQRVAEARRRAGSRFRVVESIDALLAHAPGAIAECAGHAALVQFGRQVLEGGADLVASSVGALADARFAATLARTGTRGARLRIPSGAVAGIDGLLAARSAGLREVIYTSVKPPHAWLGTPAEPAIRGASAQVRRTFFEGTAREAALAYPQNANVGATVALAGLGLDATRVALVSDPDVAGPLGIIDAVGDFGTLRFEILAYASPDNPKTSRLTAHSIVAAVLDGTAFTPPARLLG